MDQEIYDEIIKSYNQKKRISLDIKIDAKDNNEYIRNYYF